MKQAARKQLEREKAAFPKVTPPCPYVGACGGCTLQDLALLDQLAIKRGWVERALAPFSPPQPVEIVPLEDPWRYRNKAEFTFGDAAGALTLGYHRSGSYWRIVDIDDCLLLPEAACRIARTLLELAAQTGQAAYHATSHQGFFRYLLLRASHATGRVLVCLMTSSGPRDIAERLGRELARRHPDVAGFSWGVTDKLADIAVPDSLVHIAGAERLEERIGPFEIELSPFSFLQPSVVQADRIYQRLRRACEPAGRGTAWDLYCGLGLISFYLAGTFAKVYGIDTEPHNIELARQNAAKNGVRNAEFRVGKAEELLMERRFWLQEARPDLIVIDPPRAGLHPHVVSTLLAARPARLAYLSCNLQSLARDLALLGSGYPRYRIAEVAAFDMFPQTSHLETLVILDRA
ncbi:MAG TPA: 23S rRNA (uracil(1939)-C(5))-methyltransferase RlmD [bacterium]